MLIWRITLYPDYTPHNVIAFGSFFPIYNRSTRVDHKSQFDATKIANTLCAVNQLHSNTHDLSMAVYHDSCPSTHHILCRTINMLFMKSWQRKWIINGKLIERKPIDWKFTWFLRIWAFVLPSECCGPSAIHELAVSSRPCIKYMGFRVVFVSDPVSFPIRCNCKM